MLKKINKMAFIIALLITGFNANANNLSDLAQEIEIPAKCYPTKDLVKFLHPFEVVLVSEESSLVDMMVYVPAKNGIFLIRENKKIGYSCPLAFFEKKDQNKK